MFFLFSKPEKFKSYRKNPIFKIWNKKMYVSGIFYDSAKAFDCANHGFLLKLNYYGIQGEILDWLKITFK